MQVILQENISSLGNAGDVVTVKDGYGRNYLLPRGKAVLADPKNMRMLEHQKRVVAAKEMKRKKESEDLARKLGELSVTISREAGEAEKIFGSVTTKDIADVLRREGYVIDRHDIKLEEPIKQLGIFDVSVKLHPEVTGTVRVWVVKK
jgi:large subunit ribosomal protein L9